MSGVANTGGEDGDRTRLPIAEADVPKIVDYLADMNPGN